MMGLPRPAAVVCDLDGTLVDSAPDLMLATNHVLSRLERRAITMDEVRSFVGHGARALIARGCAATGDAIDEKTLDFYFAEFLRFYEKNIAVDSGMPSPMARARVQAKGSSCGSRTSS